MRGVVLGDAHAQTSTLEDLEAAVRYRRWLAGLAAPHLGEHPLEIGSGTGSYAQEWLEQGVPRLTVSEAHPERLDLLARRFAGDGRVHVRELAVPVDETADHSAVVALNVLEHVDDDVAALRALAGLVRPGGRLVLLVPAFPSALGEFDRLVGHQRRYRRRTLRAALERAGTTVTQLHHVNAVGLLGWYLVVRALGGRPRAGPLLSLNERAVVPWLSRLEARRPPPFGQSLLAVARVPPHD